jgi:hypothetical protein
MKTIKPTILLIAIMSLSFVAFNQTKESIKMVKGENLDFKIEKIITNSTDTMVYFYWGFQNQKYSSITDIGSFMFYKKEDLKLFVNGLKQISEKEKGVDFQLSIGKFGTMQLYDFSNEIYVSEKSGKYTTISKKKVSDIVTEIEKYIDLLIY